MAVEFAELGVRVNDVAPGGIETAVLSPETSALIPRIPLNRLGQPRDVASVIHWLCSDHSAYGPGPEIFATGGQRHYSGPGLDKEMGREASRGRGSQDRTITGG